MDKIQIVNWIATRNCNLRCSYCRIIKDYKNKPKEYPDMKYYYENEMSNEFIIESLRRFKLHNKNCFHILYGGEILLRKNLNEIINYCNNNNIYYTIITNNSEDVQLNLDVLFLNVEYITGLTSSVDPIIFNENYQGTDIIKKSLEGLKRLIHYKGIVKDLVAEITVDSKTVKYLYSLVEELTKHNISSSITFIDPAKSPYYDFSNVTDDSLLVKKSDEVLSILNKIIKDGLNVHMKDILISQIYESLPSNYNCNLEKDLHNLTIDANGSLRMCLRIRGIETPRFNLLETILEDGSLHPGLKRSIGRDKENYCRLCNWTCPIFSQITSKDENMVKNLLHEEIRKDHNENS
jgi:MoaA/NifB/PqqE/SkfB family radical SAM enzyme